MTLREGSALVSATLSMVGTIWYIWLALRREKIRPVLASWIVLTCTMTIGFATYWTSPNHSVVSNAGHASGVVSTLAILAILLWLHYKDRTPIRFTGFQKWCLAISAGITVLWVTLVWGLGRTGVVPNILFQILMLVGYLVTAEKLWRATENTESLFTWWCVAISSAFALYVGIVSWDLLATIYGVRATLASGTIVVLMHRVEFKQRRQLSLA